MRSTIILALFLFIGLIGCQQADNATKATKAAKENMEEMAKIANDVVQGDKKYTLTPFEPSKVYTDAKINAMTYKNGKFDFDVTGKEYKLGAQTPDAASKMCANSKKGQHIHLIIDNEPYAAKYEAQFDYDIADGDHYLLAFLSRSYHESIKRTGASTVKQISVKNKTIEKEEDVKSPMLFYSRPKGTYTGKAETDKVMLDFFLANANLGDDSYKVRANINGEEHIINIWHPYYIEGLPMGENTISLTLLDANGQKANVPLNPVTRKFTLKADPLAN